MQGCVLVKKRPTKNQRTAEEKHISFRAQKVKKVDYTKEIDDRAQGFFL